MSIANRCARNLPRLLRASRVVILATLLVVVALATTGCATLTSAMRYNAADQRFELNRSSGPVLSMNAAQIFHENALKPPANVDELAELRALVEENTTSDLVYVYAETAYLQARRVEKSRPMLAQRLYADVIFFSWHYIFNPAFTEDHLRATWNGQLADLVLLYNGASERFLQLALTDALKVKNAPFPFLHGQDSVVKMETGMIFVHTNVNPGGWNPDEFGEFCVAASCVVDSLNIDCRQKGFGVPLVVERRAGAQTRRIEEKYYPPSILFPATAVLRPNPAIPLGTLPPIEPDAFATPDAPDFTLELYDSFAISDLVQDGNALPLEKDLTTPLAYYLETHEKLASRVTRQSLLRPEELLQTTQQERQLQGLYLIDPFDPNKIPVVMTHGLASSPVTWMEMYNALRSVQGFQHGYQFMFFFYPTGQPFWASAATMRRELAEMRETVDPDRVYSALDDAVLIGHSMGGLISTMQVQSTGDMIWNVVSSSPVDSFDFDEEARNKIQDWFFYEPNPSIKRVITIATPFKGSKYANTFTKWIADRAISVPQTVASVLTSAASLATGIKDAEDDYDPALLTISTSVQSLDPTCPIFQVFNDLPVPSDVALDNIVGVLPQLERKRINPRKSDGVVDFESAHRAIAESETQTAAPHTMVHANIDSINRVRNILALHLARHSRTAQQTVYAPVAPQSASSYNSASVSFDAPTLPAEFYGPTQPQFQSSAGSEEALDVDEPTYGPSLPSEFYAPFQSQTQ